MFIFFNYPCHYITNFELKKHIMIFFSPFSQRVGVRRRRTGAGKKEKKKKEKILPRERRERKRDLVNEKMKKSILEK